MSKILSANETRLRERRSRGKSDCKDECREAFKTPECLEAGELFPSQELAQLDPVLCLFCVEQRNEYTSPPHNCICLIRILGTS